MSMRERSIAQAEAVRARNAGGAGVALGARLWRSTTELARELAAPGPAPIADLHLRIAKAASAPSGSPRTASILLAGSATSIAGVRMLASTATFATNDILAVLQQGTLLLIVDKIG